jgi:hypothetical protein
MTRYQIYEYSPPDTLLLETHTDRAVALDRARALHDESVQDQLDNPAAFLRFFFVGATTGD